MEIKFLKHKREVRFRKKDFSIYPSIYWKVILFFSFFLIIVSFLFGLYLFYKVNKEAVLTKEELGLQTETLSKERIDSVLEYFSKREEKSKEILSSPAPIVDPSI